MLIATQLRENLARVRERMAAAAKQAGRDVAEITLVGVTKYVSSDIARELFAAGVTDLGESRPQELERKTADLADLPIRWHFVGHLQRNKIKTLPNTCLLQSVDSMRLLEALQQEALSRQITWPILVEVNISGDAAKHGFSPAEMPGVISKLPEFPNLSLQGLMTMAALEGGIERARVDFRALRELRDYLATLQGTPPLPQLSMGMSDDMEAAIAEGATFVRIGSALFEGLDDGPATA